MTTLALGRRQLAAHPAPYHGATCAQVHVRRHVHDRSGEVLYPMPDGCAACGRQWFAEDEHTYMGYCGDCHPGNAMLLDYSGDVEVTPATYPQPVRARGSIRLDKCRDCGMPDGSHKFECPQGPVWRFTERKPEHPSIDDLICPGCGHLTDFGHSVICPLVTRQM